MYIEYIYCTAIQIYSDTIDTSYGVKIHKYIGTNLHVMNVYIHIRKRISYINIYIFAYGSK